MRALPTFRSAIPAAAGLICALALAGLPAAPAAAVEWGEVREIADKTFDVVLLRPLNAAAVVVGAGFFAIAAPLVAPSGEIATAFDVFVYAPYEYAFQRPLGDF